MDGDNFSTVVPIAQQQTTTENPTWHGDVTTTVSTSTDSASGLALKANIASPTFTGTVTAPNLNITGNFQMNGQTPTFSNWTVHSNENDIYRPSGNVGIGTTSPSTYLVVGEDGGSHATNVPGIHMKSTTSNTKHYAVGQDTTHNVFLTYYANSTVANGYGAVSCYGGNNNLCLQHGGGNVGIGTTSPSNKLHLGSGAIRIDANSTNYLTIIEQMIHYLIKSKIQVKNNMYKICVGGGPPHPN